MRTPQSCKLQSAYDDGPLIVPKVGGELSNTKDYNFISERLHSQGCHKRFRLAGYGYMQLVSGEWKIFPKIHTVCTSQY